MNKPLILNKKDFLGLSNDAMWREYKALANAFEVLASKHKRSLSLKGDLRETVLYKAEVISRFENDLNAFRERQIASGSQSHARTNGMVENALIFWQANKQEGEDLSHKKFQKMHRDAYPDSTLADDTYKKLKTAATKAWALYPNDLDMFIKAAKFFRNKPKGTFIPH